VNTERIRTRHKKTGVIPLLFAGALSFGGCEWFGLAPPVAPPPPADSQVLRGDTLVPEKPPEPGSPEAKLAGGHELFRRGEYSKAADLFQSIADKKKTPEPVSIEATFYEAQCYRLLGRYTKAADLYIKLLKQWPSNPYNEVADQHLFEIANYWLDDTRAAMKEAREAKDSTLWFATPRFFHIDKSKPFADEEGRAIGALE
jgi:tetratricopeptide (TPR) repeat protein